MKPCCLKVTEGSSANECGHGRRLLGGAEMFNATGCPNDADEAAVWISAKQAGSGVPKKMSESSSKSATTKHDPTIGCCYSVGFGALMKPCCLQTVHVPAGQCKKGDRLGGGASGFAAERCPQDAMEAAEWMKHKPVKHSSAENLEQEAPVPVVEDETGSSSDLALPFAFVCFLFLLIGGATVYARNVRAGRGNAMPLLEGGME